MSDKISDVDQTSINGKLFDPMPMVIAVSDIHLGAWNNKHHNFLEFLKQINSPKNAAKTSNLKILILLGDFFDILMDSYEDLATKNPLYNEIYQELNKMYLRQNKIDILLVLGNHEIQIYGNLTSRKTKFIDNFKKYNLPCLFLRKENVCQYMVLDQNLDYSRELKLYDSKRDLKKDHPFRRINLPKAPENNPSQSILIIHGHQFTRWISFVSWLFVWRPLFRYPDYLKEFLDFAWNYTKGNITKKNLGEVIENWKTGQDANKIKLMTKLLEKNQKMVFKILKLFEKSQKQRSEKLIKSIENKAIIKYLKQEKLDKITDVLFGHTHENYKSVKTWKNGQIVQIINDGAWQFIPYPSYATIELNGDISAKYF